jgi:hypothetical protein
MKLTKNRCKGVGGMVGVFSGVNLSQVHSIRVEKCYSGTPLYN